jgi:thiol-disulfide isomerase/thioredoxin
MRRNVVAAVTVVLLLVVMGCAAGGELATSVTARGIPQGTTAPSAGGRQAPSFTVPTYRGGAFSLADHLAGDGRPVFLNLWASWCFPCREEMPVIDAAVERHPGVMFIGVSVQDSTRDATAFADEIGVGYTLGFDEDGAVDDQYRPLGLPASYLISGDGVLLEEYYGQLTPDIIDQKLAQWFGG